MVLSNKDCDSEAVKVGLDKERMCVMSKACIGVIGLVSLLIVASVFSDQGNSVKGATRAVEQENSNATFLTKERADALLRERRQNIEQLLAIAQKQVSRDNVSPNSPQVLSVELLGEYRADEAAAFLVSQITLFAPATSDDMVLASGYPCVRALVKIGLPGIKAIFERLERPASNEEMKLFVTVIRLVDGNEIGLMRLEQALKAAKGESRKNVETLTKMFKTQHQYIF